MGEPIRVSIQCPHCRVIGHGADAKYTAGICQHCCMTRASFAFLAPGSLSEAIQRVGQLALAKEAADEVWSIACQPSREKSRAERDAAEAAFYSAQEAYDDAIFAARALTPPEGPG